MSSTGEPNIQAIRLPWRYSTYKTIAVLELIPILAINIWVNLNSPTSISRIFAIIGIPLALTIAYAIVITCSELEKGRIPKVAQWINLRITSRTPPQKLHRFLVGSLFLQVLFADIMFFPQPEPPFSGISLIFSALSVIGIMILFSTYSIPDNPLPQDQALNKED